MMKRLVICALVLGLGCGGDDDKDENVPEKCQMFLDAMCERAASCRAEAGDTVSTQDAEDECHASIAAMGLDCAEAVRAPSDLDRCYKELDAAACSDLEVQDDGTLANVPVSCVQ